MSNDINKEHGVGEYTDNKYLGVIVDSNDPLKIGRCRIRIFGIYEGIEDKDLPWANPNKKSTYFGKKGKGASVSIPKNGNLVEVTFASGDIYAPEYGQIQEIADDVKDELKKDGEYLGSHYILYDGDEGFKIYFTTKRGITIENKSSMIRINQDSSIEIVHKDSQSLIELKGGTIRITSDSQINMTAGSQIKASSNNVHVDGQFTRVGHSTVTGPALLGDKTFALLTVMATLIDSKFPCTPGLAANFVETFKTLALSDTVTMSK